MRDLANALNRKNQKKHKEALDLLTEAFLLSTKKLGADNENTNRTKFALDEQKRGMAALEAGEEWEYEEADEDDDDY